MNYNKFRLNDEVFIIYNNKVVSAKVNEVTINILYDCYMDEIRVIKYLLAIGEIGKGNRKFIHYDEENVFSSKEELISSII